MKIKTVLIDLDDTLSDTKPLYELAVKDCLKTFNKTTGLNYPLKKFEQLYLQARAKTKATVPTSAAKHNRAIYFQKMVEDLDIPTEFDLIYKLYQTYYHYVYHNMKLFPYALELLKWLKKTDRQVVIVSDGNAHIRLRKIHALKISPYVDFMVSSEEVGVEKPAPAQFLLALQKTDCTASQAVMIGNKAGSDTYGANLAGITTIQTLMTDYPEDRAQNPRQKPDYTVKNLKEVIKIIKQIET